MKYSILALAFVISGCATVSDYQRGCVDSVNIITNRKDGDPKVSDFCENLEKFKEEQSSKQRVRREPRER